MNRALVPIRVPSGWAVVFNIFVELPIDGDIDVDELDKYLTDDLLSIEQLTLVAGHWETDPDGVLVDLSWSDPGNPAGEYVLSVVRGGWGGPTGVFRHRDRNRIRDAIEFALSEVVVGREPDSIFV